MITSSSPVIVTVCAIFHSAGINVKVARSTDPSVGSPTVILNTTLLNGSESNTTVNTSVEPFSEVTLLPPVSAIVNPTVSSSIFVTETSSTTIPEYLVSVETAFVVTIE